MRRILTEAHFVHGVYFVHLFGALAETLGEAPKF